MLTNMFITFINMSISGAIVALLLILWRTVSYRFVPARFYYILWTALMARLLLPFAFKSQFSLLNIIKNHDRYSQGGKYMVTMEYLDYNSVVNQLEKGWAITELQLLAIIWVAVAVIILAAGFFFYISANYRLRYAVLLNDGSVQQVRRDFDMKRNIRAFVSSNVLSPLVIGFFKPRIILPKTENLSKEEVKYAIAHEMVHAKRYDQLFKAVYFICFALHWYNPLVWICLYLINEDIETSCDQQVLYVYGMEHKSRYAYVLTDYAGRRNAFELGYLSIAKNKVAKRIEKVMEYKRPTLKKGVLFTVITLVIGFSVTTNPVFAQEYQYIPQTAFVNSESRGRIQKFAEEFISNIEENDIMAIAQKSTADSEFFAPLYKIFEDDDFDMEVEKIFYTSEDSADVHIKLLNSNGAVFGKDTDKVVAQINKGRIMGGLYVESVIPYEKYNRINNIDSGDEAVQIVSKMIKFGLTDGSNTPENANKIALFCMDMAYDRMESKKMVQIPQKTVEDIAQEFFLLEDFSNLHKTDYFDKAAGVYIYDQSYGTHYEYRIVDYNRTESEATITVEFYKDPLQTQVEKIVKYTLKRI